MGELYEFEPRRVCVVKPGRTEVRGFPISVSGETLTLNGVVLTPSSTQTVPGFFHRLQWCPNATVEEETPTCQQVTKQDCITEPELMVLCGLPQKNAPPCPGYTFNFRRKAWRPNKSLIVNRDEAAIASSAFSLYAVGGITMAGITASAEAYDIAADRWSAIAPMTLARCSCAAVWVDSALYVFGGNRGNTTPTKSVEVYSALTGNWEAGDDLPTPRYRHGAAVLGSNVYVCGGINVKGEVVRDVDIYNVQSKTWTRGPPMTSPRMNFDVAVVGEHMYAVGGHSGTQSLNCAERFDANSRTWRPCACMSTARQFLTLAVRDSFIYAIGGSNINSGVLDTVERYDVLKNTWARAGTTPTPIYGHGSVVVSTARTLAES